MKKISIRRDPKVLNLEVTANIDILPKFCFPPEVKQEP